MLLASLVAVLGVGCSVAAVQLLDLRLAGVVSVPLASVYVLYEFAMLPILVGGVAVAYGTIALLRRYTLLFGRTILLAGIASGALVPVVAIRALEHVEATGPLQVAFVGSILPGIAAYNFAREDPEHRALDVRASLAVLAGLVGLGVAMVTPATAAALGDATPPILLAEGSDVAALRDVSVSTSQDGVVGREHWTTAAVLGGILISEAVYARWGLRLTGMVALPLVALFTLYDPVAAALYAVGLLAVYGLVSAIAVRTLLYGRVLLSVAIATGVVLAAVVASAGVGLPGFTLLFLGVFAGLGGYNVHRVPSPERPFAVALSAATFTGFAALFHGVGRGGAASLPRVALVGGTAMGLVGLWAAIELERARRGSKRAQEVIGA